jgi:hypothetical protein
VKYHVLKTSTSAAGEDFEPLTGLVNIGAGRSYALIDVKPLNDAVHENDESIIVGIDATSAYSVATGSASAAIVIHDDDAIATNWWNDHWHYRLPVDVSAGSSGRNGQGHRFRDRLHRCTETAPRRRCAHREFGARDRNCGRRARRR